MLKTLYVVRHDDWRAWLAKHHAAEREVWLIYYKKHSGRPRIAYSDAVEEALCFGWIDSTIQRIDDDRYAQKFTPRRNCQMWSTLNRKRVAKLLKEGRMTDAGLAKFNNLPGEEHLDAAPPEPKKELPIPKHAERALKASPLAWRNLSKLAPSYRRQCIGWITSAKKEETQLKRAREAVTRLEQGRKLGMK